MRPKLLSIQKLTVFQMFVEKKLEKNNNKKSQKGQKETKKCIQIWSTKKPKSAYKFGIPRNQKVHTNLE